MTRIISNFALLAILMLQASCSTFHSGALNKNPSSQLEKKYAFHLALEEKYSVYLDATWTTKEAHALLEVFGSMPLGLNFHFSTWNLSDDDLENGIKIETEDKLKSVTISRNILPVEDAQEVLSPSKDLYYAVVQFITESGTNRPIMKLILRERYGISIDVPSYAGLTEGATNETAEHYSDFENEDLMIFISILEEFPQALQKLPQLKYVIRRIDTDIRSAAVAWTSHGYIEFAESILGRDYVDDTRRLIAHEKAHFLWAYIFNDQLKEDWTKLGGWYQDSTSESGWSTTKERSAFVSDYAYTENPNEDMAESIGFYFVFPDRLRSCCPEKYEFIQNRIMLMYGKRYAPSNLM